MFSLVPYIHLLVPHRADNFPEMRLLHKNTMTNQPLLFHRQEVTHWIATTFSFHFNPQAKLFKQSCFLKNGEGFRLIADYFLKNKECLVNQCPKLRSLGSQFTVRPRHGLTSSEADCSELSRKTSPSLHHRRQKDVGLQVS